MLKNQITSYPKPDVAANLIYIIEKRKKNVMSVMVSTIFSESVITDLSPNSMHKHTPHT